jgi:hypothetical protein
VTRLKALTRVLPAAAAAVLLAIPAGASAAPGGRANSLPVTGDLGMREGLMMGRTAAIAPAEQSSGENYLPPTNANTELVSRLELNKPFGNVTPDQIADVGVHKNTAYLAGWSEGIFNEPCHRGGFYSVDISDPANPELLTFRPALAQNYHGEGVHAISVNTPAFSGDLLAVNNETCTEVTDPPNQNVPRGGGFDLWDVSDPANPVELSRANGDYGPEGQLTGNPPTDRVANEAHSVFLWQDGQKVYAVLVDNEERTDVDIFDVSNPRSVQPVAEFDFDERFPQIEEDPVGLGNFKGGFSHDMIVKEINGTQTMLMSYWDSGYVTLDVDDPRNPTYIGDSDFGAEDPLTGWEPPEGNGHEAEFSHDNRYILAADEDFAQFRLDAFITDGPNEGFNFQEAGGADEGGQLEPDSEFTGDTRFVGTGCTAATDPAGGGPLPAATAGVNIAVFERGICSFQEKAQQADDAGYEMALIFNNRGVDGQRCETLLNMTLGSYAGDVIAIFVARSVGFRVIDAFDEATYECDNENGTGTGTPAPAAPREGSPLSIDVLFDGWGYAHQIRNGTGKLATVDDYAIQEGIDDRWATRFGDLSIHEFATDPATNLAYISYYSGGFRAVQYDENGMREVARFIDQRPDGKGNDFWGVEQFTAANGERLIALSDRDYGLYIVRYTGPGAVGPTAQPAGPSPGRCTNIRAVTAGVPFVGAEYGEQITGTSRADRIDGGAGKDCIDGLGGPDRLRGGSDIDTIDGQRGNDRIRGNTGRGNLRGGRGNDRIWGGSRKDVLFGNTGRDRLKAGRGADQLFGGAGRDRLTGGRGRDVIEAGTGSDRIYARDGRVDRIDCGFGDDTVVTRDRKDRFTSCEHR